MVTITQDRIAGADSITLADTGNAMTPTRIVLHYSAGSTLSSAVSTLRQRELSYHVLIDTDGSLHQTRPFTRSARHAGRSNWKAAAGLENRSSLNSHSIGVSLINLGQFGWFSGGRWWWGPPGPGIPNIADEQATKRASVYRPGRPVHWTPYPQGQVDAAHAVVAALVAAYPSVTEIVGHDDIAIADKPDPGPLLPVAAWRAEFQREGPLGLPSRVASPDGTLRLRDLPSTDGAGIAMLHNGDTVHIRSVAYAGSSRGLVDGRGQRALSPWASVSVDGTNRHSGFVHMRYLNATPLSDAYATVLRG